MLGFRECSWLEYPDGIFWKEMSHLVSWIHQKWIQPAMEKITGVVTTKRKWLGKDGWLVTTNLDTNKNTWVNLDTRYDIS